MALSATDERVKSLLHVIKDFADPQRQIHDFVATEKQFFCCRHLDIRRLFFSILSKPANAAGEDQPNHTAAPTSSAPTADNSSCSVR
jgi:hypothetical protein